MKKFSKILSIFLSLVLIIVTLPIFGMFTALATTDWDYYTLRDYTGNSAPGINDTNLIGWGSQDSLLTREYVNEYAPEGTKWSLKLTSPQGNTKNIFFVNLFNDYYAYTANGSAGMRMWVANPSDKVVSLEWQYHNQSSSRIGLVPGNVPYYLQSKDSDKVYAIRTRTVLRALDNTRNVCALEIPAGFCGWLYVPYSSVHLGQHSNTDLVYKKVRFFVNSAADRDVSIYTSKIEYYSDSAFTAAGTTDYNFDTMIPNTDINSNDISTSIAVLGTSTPVTLDSTAHEGDFGQSMKAETDTSGGAVRFRILNVCANLASAGGDGVSFWIKNNHNFDLTLKVTNDGNWGLELNKPYYLKPDGEDAYTKYTVRSPISGEGNKGAIIVPANFEGRVYLPYSSSKLNGNSVEYLKTYHLELFTVTTNGVTAITINIDGIKSYTFDEIGTLTTQTFDEVTDISTVMNNYNNPVTGKDQICTDPSYTDGGTGKSIKLALQVGESWRHDFKTGSLAPSSDISTYVAGEGFRFWISNPNDFAVKMRADFYDFQYAISGRTYYLIDANGYGSAFNFLSYPFSGQTIRGVIVVPANYSGYVYVPANNIYNSVNRPVTGTTAWQFYPIIFDVEQDGYIYFDSYGMYSELPEFTARKAATVFSDGILFQQNKPINIWGFNAPGASVTAKLYNTENLATPLQTVSNIITDENGYFEFSFASRSGGYDSYRITLEDSAGIFSVINDVLIGELWLSSGQSNMEFIVGTTANNEDIFAAANDENIRVFINPTKKSSTELRDASGTYWINGTNTLEISQNTSAVALVFAYNLKAELDVPVGIINTAVGGSRIYEWFGEEATENNADILSIVNAFISSDGTGLWKACYNARIAPIAGLNIAGTIWYQGESDNYRYQYYAQELDFLKESWGELFGFDGDTMPFIFTQVAPDVYDNVWAPNVHDPFRLGYLAEAMTDAFLANENNNTAMLTVYDVPLNYGNEGEIHPNVKIPVGERFAQSAINLCYGGTGETSAPIYSSKEIKGDTVYVNFTHVGTGLSCIGDEIHGFAIAGSDGVYVNAKAKIIDSDTVMVWNDYVKSPVNVTYAFASMNQASNLKNSAGIPASPFRTNRVAETYTTIEEWMFAEADAWERYGTKESGIKNSWTVTTASGTVLYSYSSSIKTEGSNSLAVSYSGTDTVTATPVINTYRGKEFDLSKYSSIKLDVKANVGATVQLVVDGEEYGTSVTLEKSSFNKVVFEFEDAISTDASLGFKVSNLSSDVFYIDNISVGTGAKAAVFGDVNDDAALNALDVSLGIQYLLEIDVEVNLVKSDVNQDEYINILDLVWMEKLMLE